MTFQNTENAVIYTNGQTPLILGTFSSEGLRIDGLTRNVGLGTTLPTSKLHVVGDTYITGILTANRIISSLYGEFVGGSISGTNIVGTSLSISGISTLGVTSTTNLTTQNLNVTGVGTFLSSGLKIKTLNNAGNLTIVTNNGSSRTLTIPTLGANDTFAFLNTGNTWGNANTFNNNVTINANTVIQSDSGVPSQTIIIGRSTQTGTITLGLSTASQTIGIGSAIPTAALDVVGGAVTPKDIHLSLNGNYFYVLDQNQDEVKVYNTILK